MSDALEATPEEMAEYRATTRRRWEQEQQELVQREERAWEVVRRTAMLLREQFCATRVVVFGSLVRQGCFTRPKGQAIILHVRDCSNLVG